MRPLRSIVREIMVDSEPLDFNLLELYYFFKKKVNNFF